MKIFAKLEQFFLRGRLVYLRDHDGECVTRLAKKTPFGELIAKRYGWRNVILNEDGSVSGLSYVQQWKYIND